MSSGKILWLVFAESDNGRATKDSRHSRLKAWEARSCGGIREVYRSKRRWWEWKVGRMRYLCFVVFRRLKMRLGNSKAFSNKRSTRVKRDITSLLCHILCGATNLGTAPLLPSSPLPLFFLIFSFSFLTFKKTCSCNHNNGQGICTAGQEVNGFYGGNPFGYKTRYQV